MADVSFKVLNLLSRERGVYGLRNGDHERYRRHCANKVHRFRQVTGQTSGKGKVYKKPAEPTVESITDSRNLQLILFNAERALAHSHEFKALLGKPTAPPSARREQISWLRRAAKLSSSLYELAQALSESGRMNQQTLAEFTIYNLSIRAELNFERSAHAEVLADLAARRQLLSTLATAARDSYDQALATEFADAYDPLIRFSAYKLGRAESHDIDGVVADIDDEMKEEAVPGFAKLNDALRTETNAEEMEAGRKTLEDVKFAGTKIEFRNAELVAAMLKVQEALARLDKKGKASGRGRGGMKGWDRVLHVLGEAEGTARHLLDDHEAGASASLRSTETAKSLSLAHQYIVYVLLSHRIRRDLLLVDSLSAGKSALPSDPAVFKVPGGRAKVEEAVKSLAAVVKLYDTVLQSLSQLRSLAIVEEADGVRRAAEGAEAYYHATRCYHLARSHCIHPTPSYAAAVQLLERADKFAQQASDAQEGEVEEEVVHLTKEQVDDLAKKVSALELAAKRALFAQTVSKPIFYDGAFNYIDLPMDELLVKAGRSDPKPAEPVKIQQPKAVPAKTKAAPAVCEKTREATPQPDPQDEQDQEQGKKGWLGGWFGRS